MYKLLGLYIAKAPAILQAWFPGQEGSVALANVLLGKASPSGNATATIVDCLAQGGNLSSIASSTISSRSSSSSNTLTTSKSSSSSTVSISSSKSSTSSITNNLIYTFEENSAGFCDVEGTIDSNHAGYRGIGFANADNENGKGIDYAVNAPSSGSYQIKLRYANGAAARSVNLLVNGVNAGSLTFATGAWSSWVETSLITVSLKQGNNLLRLQATDSNGLANVDSLSINGNRPTAGQCVSSNSAITLWIAGDSTVANGGSSCAFGWGRDFASNFNSNVSVQNLAVGGRSVRMWLYDVQSTIGSDGECALTKDASGKPIIQSRWQTTLSGMKSNDDEYLFHALSASITSNPIALNQLSTKVKRAFIENPVKFQKFFEHNELATLEHLEEQAIENGMLVGIGESSIDRILEQCARGLFFHETRRKCLGQSRVVTFFTMYTEPWKQQKAEEVYSYAKRHFLGIPEKGENPDIFKYKLFESENDIFIFMAFYGTSEALVRVLK